MKKRTRWVAGVALIAGATLVSMVMVRQPALSAPGNAAVPVTQEKVLILGASVAEGWDDKAGGGYLIRAFKSLSAASHVQYQVDNKAAAGDGVLQIVKQYPGWLNTVKPNIVVISWGALDDLHMGTPLATVKAQVIWEADLALHHHATVFLVTPPVTRASYVGKLAIPEIHYVNAELAAFRTIHNPNVYVSDVFNQMKAYIKAHHQTVQPYVGDGWHPNSAGHILAGKLLTADIEKIFGQSAITFKTS